MTEVQTPFLPDKKPQDSLFFMKLALAMLADSLRELADKISFCMENMENPK